MRNPRAKIVPSSPRPGDVIEVKTLITHVMESGSRKNKEGTVVPRHVIHSFSATFEGKNVFRVELGPGISENPYLSFRMRVPASGTLKLVWVEDGGATASLDVPITAAG